MSAAATLLLLAGLAVVVVIAGAVIAWRRLRRTRLIICPETRAPAAVRLDATSAAINAVIDSRSLSLDRCSRWPARRFCDQACRPQIETGRDDTVVETIVGRWFADRRCVYCDWAITDRPIVHHHAALLGVDGTTVEWPEVAPERLPAYFRSHLPVCWNCHIAATFRRAHPELVTDREATRTSTKTAAAENLERHV